MGGRSNSGSLLMGPFWQAAVIWPGQSPRPEENLKVLIGNVWAQKVSGGFSWKHFAQGEGLGETLWPAF